MDRMQPRNLCRRYVVYSHTENGIWEQHNNITCRREEEENTCRKQEEEEIQKIVLQKTDNQNDIVTGPVMKAEAVAWNAEI